MYIIFNFGLLQKIVEISFREESFENIFDQFHLRRFGISFVLTLLGEAIIAFYQYFVTASFEWFIVQNMFVRSGLTAALVVIFCPLLNRIFHRRRKRAAHHSGRGSKREVKHF